MSEFRWDGLGDCLASQEDFVIVSHARPDGDALGSCLALAGFLRQLGKRVRVVNPSLVPPRYAFLLEQLGEVLTFQPNQIDGLNQSQAIIVLDLSSRSQLGPMADWVASRGDILWTIDHHVEGESWPGWIYRDCSAESTATLVLRLARAMNWPLTPAIATGLYTGIATDTGWFRHPNTSTRTMSDASELIEAGAVPSQTFRKLYESDRLERIKLTGRALSNMETCEQGRIALTYLTLNDFQETGADSSETEDVINFTVRISGVELGIMLVEQSVQKIKVSFRSPTNFDCSGLAAQFGGGGHRVAAGATITGEFSAIYEQVIAAARTRLLNPISTAN